MTARLIIDNAPELHAAIDRRDADFHDGYEAGYRAKADHRAALGTAAYRQGHAYGVQQANAERRVRAGLEQPRAVARRRFRAALYTGFIIGALLALLMWASSARADTLTEWNQLNETCQGGRGAASAKACTQRQAATAQLRREGWFEGAHGVWVSPEHVATFVRIVRGYDAIARENTGMLDKVMEGMMTDLRRTLPPEAIFALWNARAGQLLATTPYAASMLMYGLPYLERMLSGKNDPRFVMVLRP